MIRNRLLVLSVSVNLLLAAGIAGVTGWKYYRKMTRPFRSDYYETKVSNYGILGTERADIVFVGDSHTDRCEWSELFHRCGIINRGIDGDTTDGVLKRLSGITSMKPRKIFLMIGAADFIIGRSVPLITANYKMIIARIRAETPETILYIQSVLPTVYRIVPMPREQIRSLNREIKGMADNRHVVYIDLYNRMIDSTGDLEPSYSIDGVHLTGRGYLVWRDALMPFMR